MNKGVFATILVRISFATILQNYQNISIYYLNGEWVKISKIWMSLDPTPY
jgi:hypothetical protein